MMHSYYQPSPLIVLLFHWQVTRDWRIKSQLAGIFSSDKFQYSDIGNREIIPTAFNNSASMQRRIRNSRGVITRFRERFHLDFCMFRMRFHCLH